MREQEKTLERILKTQETILGSQSTIVDAVASHGHLQFQIDENKSSIRSLDSDLDLVRQDVDNVEKSMSVLQIESRSRFWVVSTIAGAVATITAIAVSIFF